MPLIQDKVIKKIRKKAKPESKGKEIL